MKTPTKLAVIVSLLAGIATAGVVQSAAAKCTKIAAPAADHRLAPGLVVPTMDPVRGKHLFASKGCVVCHSINEIGGTDASRHDASTMAPMMNPFDFFPKMWRGAVPMIAMQRHEIGHHLADIVAFVHNRQVQKTFSATDIPPAIKKHMDND